MGYPEAIVIAAAVCSGFWCIARVIIGLAGTVEPTRKSKASIVIEADTRQAVRSLEDLQGKIDDLITKQKEAGL